MRQPMHDRSAITIIRAARAYSSRMRTRARARITPMAPQARVFGSRKAIWGRARNIDATRH